MTEQPLTNNQMKQIDKAKLFNQLFELSLQNKSVTIPTIEYNLPYPKEEFLKFLVEHKNMLLHGSPSQDLEALEPRQANDGAKESGNKNAVYGISDPVIAIFFAIQNRDKINGTVESGTWDNPETGKQEYRFKIPKNSQETFLTDGIIYILDKKDFALEKDDQGHNSGEHTSEVAVRPVAKIQIKPSDFKHLDKVKFE